MTEAVKVEGLAQFARNLKRLDPEQAKQLRVSLNDAAGLVVDKAVPGIPRKTGKAARSVKARSTRTEARVSAGGSRVPWYPWLDFGGKVGRHKSVERPFFTRGRYLYPAYFSLRDSGQFQEVLAEALSKAIAAAGLAED